MTVGVVGARSFPKVVGRVHWGSELEMVVSDISRLDAALKEKERRALSG